MAALFCERAWVDYSFETSISLPTYIVPLVNPHSYCQRISKYCYTNVPISCETKMNIWKNGRDELLCVRVATLLRSKYVSIPRAI